MCPLSLIPTHSIALWLLNTIDKFLDLIGLHRYQAIEELVYFAIILAASFFIGWIVRRFILWGLRKMLKLHSTDFGRELLREHTLTKCSHIIPPLVFLALVPFAFESSADFHTLIVRAALVYLFIMMGIALVAIMKFVYLRLNERENSKGLPLQGILNIAIGIVWAVVLIISVSVIVQKSPAALLGGLTAFAAVLMLVFKDTILGFVAGIQMSQNDMVRVGDWIVVPSTIANGIVEDVSLTTVKVRNWDNTLVTVPPYSLVSSSFQNWRGMTESGVRRICQCVYINPDSIEAVSADRVDAIVAKFPCLKDFVDKLRQKEVKFSSFQGIDPVNGSVETNLGMYRAYLTTYLVESDLIDHNSDLMVHIVDPSHEGIPLQIYCFSVVTQWEGYVAILSGIIEHALAVAPDFGLEVLSADHLSVTTSPEGKAADVSVAPVSPQKNAPAAPAAPSK